MKKEMKKVSEFVNAGFENEANHLILMRDEVQEQSMTSFQGSIAEGAAMLAEVMEKDEDMVEMVKLALKLNTLHEKLGVPSGLLREFLQAKRSGKDPMEELIKGMFNTDKKEG